jgi:hypothetical protein
MSARTLDGGCGLLGVVVVVIVASAEGRVAAVLVLAAALVLRGHVVAVSEHGVAAVPGVLTFFAFLSSFSFFFFAPEACALYAARDEAKPASSFWSEPSRGIGERVVLIALRETSLVVLGTQPHQRPKRAGFGSSTLGSVCFGQWHTF